MEFSEENKDLIEQLSNIDLNLVQKIIQDGLWSGRPRTVHVPICSWDGQGQGRCFHGYSLKREKIILRL